MKYRNACLVPVIIACAYVLIFCGQVWAGGGKVDSVDLDLENSLIIKEIEMESEPDEVRSPNGKISVEEPFDAEEAEADVDSGQKGAPEKQLRSGDLIRDLAARDGRWHVSMYTIRQGDSLWRISRMFGVSHRIIIRANNISDPNMLVPGMTIKVPNRNGIDHQVKKGDSIYGLAKKYRVPADAIISQNRVNPRSLPVGKKLFIPDATRPALAVRTTNGKRNGNRNTRHGLARNQRQEHNIYSEPIRNGFAFLWPIKGRITSGFGTRKDPFSGKRKFHCGIDISAEEGTPVRCSADGTVIFSDWKNGYGKAVVVRHRNGYITVYAHNSNNAVQKGDDVEKGQILALSGSTGAVTGAHLHFEIRKYVTPLNPERFLN